MEFFCIPEKRPFSAAQFPAIRTAERGAERRRGVFSRFSHREATVRLCAVPRHPARPSGVRSAGGGRLSRFSHREAPTGPRRAYRPQAGRKRRYGLLPNAANPPGAVLPGGSKVHLSPARSPRCGLHRLRLSGPLPGLLTPQDALLHHRYDMVNGFGAVLHQPFRNDGHQSTDIECHDIFPVPIRDPEPLQNRREHMPEQPVIGLVQAQRSGILDGGSEKPSVILCKIQIGNQIFRC